MALPYDGAAAVRHLRRADPKLAPLLAQVGPLRLEVPRRFEPFEALASAIAHQQLTGKAAKTILGRFCGLFPARAFPRAEDVRAAPVEQLRSVGFSGSKVAALKDLAEKVVSGEVPSAAVLRKLEDEAIVERLTRVRGIGTWTVQMLLIFRLGRPDVLPVLDYGVRKGFTLALRKRQLVTPAALLSYGERWRPYRSVASWYLWRALDP